MKQVGIVADNHKVARFKKEFKEANFEVIYEGKMTYNTTLLKVSVEDDQIQKVHALCSKVESHFNRSN